MSYFGELRQNARPLTAASLGAGVSLPFFAYTNTVFSPHLIAEFGWSRAQFALVGITMLATLLVLPVIGRLTDRLGVKRVALGGTLLLPLCFVAYAMQTGSFIFFLVIATSVLMLGSLTSPLVYSRLIAENFRNAQGLALTVMNCVPAAFAIPAVPLLNWIIDVWGWREAYLLLGVIVMLGGLAALMLVPKRKTVETGPETMETPLPKPSARSDYRLILKSGVFWIIFMGFFLCLLQTPLHAAQMNIMLMDNGLTTQGAANIVSVYAAGTIIGRIACGLALDRYSTRVVTAVSMGIPAIGYLLLGSPMDTIALITFAMFLVGVSVGAESDLISYLVARYFKLRIYSTTLGVVYVCSFAASASGALLISGTLTIWDSFTPFLYLVAGTVTVGSLLFLFLPPGRDGDKIG